VLDPTAPFRCAELSPDGKVLAVGLGDVGPGATRAVRFRDAVTLLPLPGELPAKGRDQIEAMAYAPDGRFLFTAQSDGTVSPWDVRLGVTEEEQVHCDSGVHAIVLSHDGTHVFTAGATGPSPRGAPPT
jgi:WD40 repeat protein